MQDTIYFTTFSYDYPGSDHSIIHMEPAAPYAEDLAQYKQYFSVERKPTLEEANVIFSVCKSGTLCAGIKRAKTEILK